MEEITVNGVENRLAVLGVAQGQREMAEDRLADAEMTYRFAIKIIESAMEADPLVTEARERLDTARQIEEDATTCVSRIAISAWREGLTDGKKEWRQGNWEIRLRTTITPVVAHVENFIAHLAELKAAGIVKRVTLNRKATVDLNAAVKLAGLEIEEKTICSAKCVSK